MAEPMIYTDFVGGPCSGVFKQVPVSQLKTNAVTCAGATYVVTGHTPTAYTVTYEPDARPIEGTPQFDQAWTTLMHTLAFRIPAQLNRQQVALQRIRRAVR